jgi:hypothetical protein
VNVLLTTNKGFVTAPKSFPADFKIRDPERLKLIDQAFFEQIEEMRTNGMEVD